MRYQKYFRIERLDFSKNPDYTPPDHFLRARSLTQHGFDSCRDAITQIVFAGVSSIVAVFVDDSLEKRPLYLSKHRRWFEGLNSRGLQRGRYSGGSLGTRGKREKKYVHFAEDGFRDNRAGACCVQKARPYVTSETTSSHFMYASVHRQTGKYLRSQTLHLPTVLLLRYAQTSESEETARGRERGGKGANSRKKNLSTIRLRSRGTPLKLFTDKHMRFFLRSHFVFLKRKEE